MKWNSVGAGWMLAIVAALGGRSRASPIDSVDFLDGNVLNIQGTTWTSSRVGIDEVGLTNGELIGWVDVYPNPPKPILPETTPQGSILPEPCGALPLVIFSVRELKRPRRRRRPR
jgi:hypothetical protein